MTELRLGVASQDLSSLRWLQNGLALLLVTEVPQRGQEHEVMQPQRELLIEKETLIGVHFQALWEELAEPDELFSVDVDELSSRAMEDGGVEAQDWVVVDQCLLPQEVLVLLGASVDDYTQVLAGEGRLCALLLEHGS